MKALLVILMFLMFASSLGGRNSQLDFLRKSKQIFNEFADKAPVLLQEIGELFFDPDFSQNISSCTLEKLPESLGRNPGRVSYSDAVGIFDAHYACM